jgi:hypothetical protein
LKKLIFGLILTIFALSACDQHNSNTTSVAAIDTAADKKEIISLVQNMLKWSETKNRIDILPLPENVKDTVYTNLDLTQHALNLDKLKKTDMFASEFIDNYNQIIWTIDKKLRNGEYLAWPTGDLPPFNFASDADPWCLCQDTPSQNYWDLIETSFQKLSKEKATLTWTWGHSEWSKQFSYKVRATKEDGKWKIAYLQGFDYAEATR